MWILYLCAFLISHGLVDADYNFVAPIDMDDGTQQVATLLNGRVALTSRTEQHAELTSLHTIDFHFYFGDFYITSYKQRIGPQTVIRLGMKMLAMILPDDIPAAANTYSVAMSDRPMSDYPNDFRYSVCFLREDGPRQCFNDLAGMIGTDRNEHILIQRNQPPIDFDDPKVFVVGGPITFIDATTVVGITVGHSRNELAAESLDVYHPILHDCVTYTSNHEDHKMIVKVKTKVPAELQAAIVATAFDTTIRYSTFIAERIALAGFPEEDAMNFRCVTYLFNLVDANAYIRVMKTVDLAVYNIEPLLLAFLLPNSIIETRYIRPLRSPNGVLNTKDKQYRVYRQYLDTATNTLIVEDHTIDFQRRDIRSDTVGFDYQTIRLMYIGSVMIGRDVGGNLELNGLLREVTVKGEPLIVRPNSWMTQLIYVFPLVKNDEATMPKTYVKELKDLIHKSETRGARYTVHDSIKTKIVKLVGGLAKNLRANSVLYETLRKILKIVNAFVPKQEVELDELAPLLKYIVPFFFSNS